jgi:hypothetical protein
VTNQNVVYGTDVNGNPLNRTVNTLAANAGVIVERIIDGQITVPASPSAATDATSKQYADQHSGLFTGVGVSSVAGASPLLTGITTANIAEGARIRVRFPNGVSNRTAPVNLTVNGANATIQINGAVISSTNPLTIPANESRVFVRMGSVWNMMTSEMSLRMDLRGNIYPHPAPLIGAHNLIFENNSTYANSPIFTVPNMTGRVILVEITIFNFRSTNIVQWEQDTSTHHTYHSGGTLGTSRVNFPSATTVTVNNRTQTSAGGTSDHGVGTRLRIFSLT